MTDAGMTGAGITQALETLVQAWLPSQRWFAGKGRAQNISLELLATLSQDVAVWIVGVEYDDATSEAYQLPLVMHETPTETLEHVLLGTVDGPDGLLWVYDALHDKDVTPVWLTGIRDAATDGPLQFTLYAEPDDIPVTEPSLVLTGEQSNTSLMFGDLALLKVFRRLQPGVNPDIEIHAALGAVGARHIARLLGAVQGEFDGQVYALAMLQEYMTTATDGWELAKASVRDLLAERDLHADEAGGDFAGEAHRLGAAVAQTHLDLATVFPTSTMDAAARMEQAAGMLTRLHRGAQIVPQLAEMAEGLEAVFAAAAESSSGLFQQRIHGDLHLGQALRTVHRWVIIDFEGEPMVDLSARRAPDSPLRDVAGMLRSFEYAGYHRLVEGEADAQLAYRADEWVTRNRGAFCDGYASIAGEDPREHDVLLRAYEADKAVYEAVYEARNRPAWLPIPLTSLHRLVGSQAVR